MTLADLETTWLARADTVRGGWEHSNKWEGADSVKRCADELMALWTPALSRTAQLSSRFAASGGQVPHHANTIRGGYEHSNKWNEPIQSKSAHTSYTPSSLPSEEDVFHDRSRQRG